MPGNSLGAAAWVVLALPDPGCESCLTPFVSQGHYLESGDNDRTELTGSLWGLKELINATSSGGAWHAVSVWYFRMRVLQTPEEVVLLTDMDDVESPEFQSRKVGETPLWFKRAAECTCGETIPLNMVVSAN